MWRGVVLAFWLLAMWASPATADSSVDVSIDPGGHYVVQFHSPEMTFGGAIGQPPTNVRTMDRHDGVGDLHSVEFDYSGRTSRITACEGCSGGAKVRSKPCEASCGSGSAIAITGSRRGAHAAFSRRAKSRNPVFHRTSIIPPASGILGPGSALARA